MRTVPKAEEAPASREPLLVLKLDVSSPTGRRDFLLVPFYTLMSHAKSDLSPLESGGDDGARTRDLCRDRVQLLLES